MTDTLKRLANKLMYRLFGHLPYKQFKDELLQDRLDVNYYDSSYNAFDANSKPFNFN
jgi:hypothetical protein